MLVNFIPTCQITSCSIFDLSNTIQVLVDVIVWSTDCVLCRAVTLSTSENCSDAPVRPGQHDSVWRVGQLAASNWRRLAPFSLRQWRKSCTRSVARVVLDENFKEFCPRRWGGAGPRRSYFSVREFGMNVCFRRQMKSQLDNLLDRKGREWCLRQVSETNFGTVWPWSLTSWPQKSIVSSLAQ